RPRPGQAAQGYDPLLRRLRPERDHGAPDPQARPGRGRLQRDLHRQPGDPRGGRGGDGGGGLLPPARLAQPGAHRHRHRGGGDRARGPGPRGAVRQGARGVRPADRQEPGDRPSARPRDGPARRGRDDVPQGRVALRPRQALRARGQRGQDAGGRGRLQRLRRRAPDLRRLRLRHGVPRGASLARDPPLQDRAGVAADGAQLPGRARAGPPALLLAAMELMLSTHDTGYERPDGPTIAKVLASLDGGRNVLATLGTSDSSYLQASGSVQSGFGLDLQEGSIERRFRTRDRALPLAWVTEAFQRYARADLGW